MHRQQPEKDKQNLDRAPPLEKFLRTLMLPRSDLSMKVVKNIHNVVCKKSMGVCKQSISKFLIGNRFHVKLRILIPGPGLRMIKTKILIFSKLLRKRKILIFWKKFFGNFRTLWKTSFRAYL